MHCCSDRPVPGVPSFQGCECRKKLPVLHFRLRSDNLPPSDSRILQVIWSLLPDGHEHIWCKLRNVPVYLIPLQPEYRMPLLLRSSCGILLLYSKAHRFYRYVHYNSSHSDPHCLLFLQIWTFVLQETEKVLIPVCEKPRYLPNPHILQNTPDLTTDYHWYEAASHSVCTISWFLYNHSGMIFL